MSLDSEAPWTAGGGTGVAPVTPGHRRDRRRAVLGALLVVSVVAVVPGGSGATAAADGEATILHEGDRLRLANTTGQAVYGRTDRPPGSTVTVMLRSSGPSPFLMSAATTVTESGRFRTTFDLSSVAPGSEFVARVSANGTELASTSGVVTECGAGCPPAPPATPEATVVPAGEGDGNYTLAAGPGRAVRGRSNLPPGTRVRVRFRGADGRLPPLETAAVVDDRGRFLAVADLSGVAVGTDLRVSVRHEGARLAERRVTVVECERGCRSGREPGTGNATLFAGRNGTATPRVVETVRGRRVRLPLSLGDAETGTLSVGGPAGSYALDVVVRDGNGDGRVGLVIDTGNVSDTGDVGRSVRTVDDEDAATVERVADGRDRTDRAVPGALDAGEYPLALYRGDYADRLVGLLVVRPAGGEPDGGAATRFAFRRSPLTVRSGRTTQVPVALDEAGSATFVVNGSGYALRATVRDGSGDEHVTLRFDTGTDADPRLTAVEEADSVTLRVENGSVGPGEYRLALHRGANVTRERTPPDLWSASGTLIVAEAPSTPSGGGTPIDGPSMPALAALGLGGLLAVAGLALLTGAVEP